MIVSAELSEKLRETFGWEGTPFVLDNSIETIYSLEDVLSHLPAYVNREDGKWFLMFSKEVSGTLWQGTYEKINEHEFNECLYTPTDANLADVAAKLALLLKKDGYIK